MTTQLHTLLHASLALSQGTDPKAQANGYSHSFLDPKTAQLELLAVFLPDIEIEVAACQAWDEAISLLSLIGIEFNDITAQESSSQGIGDPFSSIHEGSSGGHDHQAESEDDDDEDSEAIQLTRLICVQRTRDWETVDENLQEKMHILMCAAMALDINEMEKL